MDQHTTDVLTPIDPRDRVARVWSRYTDLIVERGEGAWLQTTDGERYLDLTAGIGVASTGHAHPRVAAAIAEQAGRVIHAQQNIVHHGPSLELHERLPHQFPGRDAADVGVFLSNSGAEAIEAAVKLAKVATGRRSIVAFRGGFHGRTHLAMALTTSNIKYRAGFEPLVPEIHVAPYAYPLRNPTGRSAAQTTAYAMAGLDAILRSEVRPDQVAAILVEPILGEGGYVVPPDDFLPRLRELADRHGMLLIADEVQTGFGRTGRMFASEWTGVVPDIIVMAKGIASGLPLSGIMAPRALLDALPPGSHGGTFGGNAVSCAAALATLDVIRDEGLIERSERVGARLMSGLMGLAERHGCIAEVRGRGLMIGIEFADRQTLEPLAHVASRVMAEALKRHVLLLSCGTYGQVVRLVPPLVITDDDARLALDTLAESLEAAGA